MPPSFSHTATTPTTAALVVAVVGSYRKGGVTDRLVDDMLAEVVAQGHAAQKVYLSEVPIEFCRNCRRCTQTPGTERGACVLQDGLPALLEVLDRADGLILASPVNIFTTTALTKRFVERLICGTYWPWGQRAPRLRCNSPQRRALLVCSCAMPAFLARRVTNVLRVLKSAAAALGARPVGSLVVGLVAQREQPTLPERSRRRARKLTRKLLKGLPLEKGANSGQTNGKAMKTYYLEFFATEAPVGAGNCPREDKRVRFWVVDRDPDSALRRAHHYLMQNGWQPADLARAPAELGTPGDTTAAEETALYQQAQRFGIAMAVSEL